MPRPVVIGNHVWIGCDCRILKGVTIVDNVVISAGSTVRHSLGTPNSVYGAKSSDIQLLKESISWAKTCLNE